MACADASDAAHARCCTARDGALEAGQTLITTDFVVDETLTLLRMRLGLMAAERWWKQIERSSGLRWERIDSDRFEKARQLFFKYRDKDFYFTDCTSCVTMRELRLTHALTTDRHFRRYGISGYCPQRGAARREHLSDASHLSFTSPQSGRRTAGPSPWTRSPSTFNAGEIFGLIGPNGAGKTTTMECVEGLRTPDRGVISVLGLDPTRQVYALQERIGVQLQEAQLQKRIKVREAVAFWASLYRKPVDGDRLIEQLGLSDKRNAWFMTLSGGQKQRLFIALALINDPELVFLDELTTGLDPQARRAIWDLVRGIRQRGKTVFLTTHLMEEAERLCDRVAIIDHGRIIDIGTPAELVRRHCPERTVIVVTEDSTAPERFRAIPQVQSVSSQGLQLTIRGRGTIW